MHVITFLFLYYLYSDSSFPLSSLISRARNLPCFWAPLGYAGDPEFALFRVVFISKLVRTPVSGDINKLVRAPVSGDINKLVRAPVSGDINKLVRTPVTEVKRSFSLKMSMLHSMTIIAWHKTHTCAPAWDPLPMLWGQRSTWGHSGSQGSKGHFHQKCFFYRLHGMAM